jgi:hypothetical protein
MVRSLKGREKAKSEKRKPQAKKVAAKAPAKKPSAKKSTSKAKARQAPAASVDSTWRAIADAPDDAARRSVAAFQKLEEVSKITVWEIRQQTGRPLLDGWIADFVDAIDERWLPVLDARFEKIGHLEEEDRRIVFGVVSGLCKLLGNVPAIVKRFPKTRRKKFGFVLGMEYWRGIARLGTDEAIAHIAEEVDQWIEAVNRREYGTPAFDALLLLDRPETHARIARLLETITPNPHNWMAAVDAAVAAGRFRAKQCLPGLRRVIDGGLGDFTRYGETREAARKRLDDAVAAIETAS